MKSECVRYTRVLYDRRDQKRALIVAIVSTVLVIVSCAIIFSPLFDRFPTALLVMVTLAGVVMIPFLAVASWFTYAMCTGYLNRLRAYGYEVPAFKSDYKGLEELPRSETVHRQTENSRESIALAVICWGIAAACMVGTLPLILNYQMYSGLLFHGAAALFWVVLGMGYFRQRSREKYRDDVESEVYGGDNNAKRRKMRTQLANGLVTIAVLAFFTILFLIIIYNFGGVIFRARLAGGAGV